MKFGVFVAGFALLLASNSIHAEEIFFFDLRGEVKTVDPADAAEKKTGLIATIIVESEKSIENPFKGEKASIRIAPSSRIEKQVGEKSVPAKLEDIVPGSIIEVRFKGEIRNNLSPPSALASIITILPAPKKK